MESTILAVYFIYQKYNSNQCLKTNWQIIYVIIPVEVVSVIILRWSAVQDEIVA